MAKTNTQSETVAEKRTAPMDVPPAETNGLLAAWDGIYHFFAGRWESVERTPDGYALKGFTVNADYDPNTIIRDVNRRNRRVPLFPTIEWLEGAIPAPIDTPQKMTTYMVQFFRGGVEEGSTRSPVYVRQAVANFKSANGTSKKRGPKPRTISLKELASLDVSILTNAKVETADLQHLIAVAQEALASQATSAPVMETVSES